MNLIKIWTFLLTIIFTVADIGDTAKGDDFHNTEYKAKMEEAPAPAPLYLVNQRQVIIPVY